MSNMKKTFELAFAIEGKLGATFKTAHGEAASAIERLSKKSQEAMNFRKLNKEFDESFNKFNKAASDMGAAWKGVADSIVGPLKQIATVGAIAGTAVYALAHKTAKMGDDAVKGALKIGVTTEEFTKMSFAATQSGVAADSFASNMGKLNSIIQKQVINGKTDLMINGKRLIKLRDENKQVKSRTQLLLETADAYKKLTDENEKNTLATMMFGKSGAEMKLILDQGSAGIQKLMNDADRLGIVFDEVAGKKASAFIDSWGELKAAAQGLSIAVGQQLHEPLTRINNAVVGWITANRELIGQKVGEFVQDIIKWVKENKQGIIDMKNSVVEFVHQMGVWIEKNGGLLEVLKKVGKAFIAFKALGIGFALLSAVGATMAFAASLFSLIVNVKLALAAFGGFKVVAGLIAGIAAPVAFIAAAVVSLGVATYLLVKNWSEVVYFFQNLGKTVPIFINDLVEDIKGLFGILPGWIQDIIAPIKNIIISPIQAVQDLLAGNIKGFFVNMGKFIMGQMLLLPSLIASAGNQIIKAIFGVDIIGAVKEWISPVVTVIDNILGAGIGAIVDFFIGEFNDVKNAFGEGFFNGIFTILKKIPTLFIRMGIDIVKALMTVDISPVIDWAKSIFDSIKAVFNWIGGLVSKSFKAITDFIGGELDAIKQAFAGGFVNGIASILWRIPTFFVRMGADVIKAITGIDLISVGKRWIGGLISAVGAAISGLVSVVSAAFRAFTTVFSDELDAIKNLFSGIFTGMVDFVKGFFMGEVMGIVTSFDNGFLKGIGNIFERLVTMIPRLLNNVVKAITGIDIIGTGKEWIQRFIDGVLAVLKNSAGIVQNTIKGLLPESVLNIAGKASKVVSNVSGAVGGAVKAVSNAVPKFSDGGIATGPYLAAEDNKPEAIIPLTKPRRAAEIIGQIAPTLQLAQNIASPKSPISPIVAAAPNREIPDSLKTPPEFRQNKDGNKSKGGTFNFSPNINITGGGGGDVAAVKAAVQDALAKAQAEFMRMLNQKNYLDQRLAIE